MQTKKNDSHYQFHHFSLASTSADQRILRPRLIGESSNSNHIAQNEPHIHIGSSTSNQLFNHRRKLSFLLLGSNHFKVSICCKDSFTYTHDTPFRHYIWTIESWWSTSFLQPLWCFFFWYEERTRRERHTSNPSYNLCCKGGRIWLPPYQPPPQPLLDLLTSQNSTLSNHFFDHIRQYNSIFVITSMGAKINESINDGRAPYVFKISGQVYHRIGSLLPPQGHRPEYAQLYIFDTEHEISNRINVASSPHVTFHANEQIVASLIEMLNTNNPIVQLFRTTHERISLDASDQFCIRLFGIAVVATVSYLTIN